MSISVLSRVARLLSCAILAAPALLTAPTAAGAETLRVAYAGSMGVVMDGALGPAFAKEHSAGYQGIGQGSYGLARLIAARQMRADVFVSITPGPMEILLRSGLVSAAYPVASTQMVIAYNPRSRFAPELKAAAGGSRPWYEVLELPGLRFGRTDPAVDPQGRNIILTMILAERYYGRPGLAARILGPYENPAQIFTEPSLLSRLEAGEIDAASGYRSAAVSHHLPFIALPDQINLSDPALAAAWYGRASFELARPKGGSERVTSEPLVFYAAALRDSRAGGLAGAFVAYLRSSAARRIFEAHGYGPPLGDALR